MVNPVRSEDGDRILVGDVERDEHEPSNQDGQFFFQDYMIWQKIPHPQKNPRKMGVKKENLGKVSVDN